MDKSCSLLIPDFAAVRISSSDTKLAVPQGSLYFLQPFCLFGINISLISTSSAICVADDISVISGQEVM